MRPTGQRARRHHFDLALLVLYSAFALLGCHGRTPDARGSLSGYNLILINIDSLRADHLSLYGHTRATSPFLDGLASEGITYENAFANSSYTRTSVASLFTGRLPSSAGIVGWDSKPPQGTPTLAEHMLQTGYSTAFLSNTTMLKDPGFTRGFETITHLPAAWGISRAGARLTRSAGHFLEEHKKEKFFLYLHYLDPHGPYDPPDERYLTFADEKSPSPIMLYTDVRPRCTELVRGGFGPGDPRFDDMVLRYDAEILDTDAALGSLLSALKDLSLENRTLIVVTADHGEEFLEHGFVEHAWTLYRESLHIPLVFWAPGALEPRRVHNRVSAVDVVPTVLSLLAIRTKPRVFDGEPLLVRRVDRWADRAPQQPLVAELLIAERNILRSISTHGFTYIAAERWLEPAARPEAAEKEEMLRNSTRGTPFPIWGAVVHEELYRDSDDPGQQHDLLEQEPVQLALMRRELSRYQAACSHGAQDSRETGDSLPPPTPQDRERMRSLGYL